ncbi:MAG TPA: TolC family protein [Chthoniobacter sp.]|jgi:outer membrane protein TolC
MMSLYSTILNNEDKPTTVGLRVVRFLKWVGGVTLLASASSGALGANDHPPPSPDKPWAPPRIQEYERDLSDHRSESSVGKSGVIVDSEKIYTLPEIIDLAERTNPDTRVAWERARQAAAAVGLSKSFYYPLLMASAGTGYDRLFIPFPKLDVSLNSQRVVAQAKSALKDHPTDPAAAIQQASGQLLNDLSVSIAGGGSLVVDSVASRMELNAKWLLVDFGQRHALVDASRQRLMMANVGFNATHQKIVFEVTQRFYELNVAREKVKVARGAYRAAQTVEQSARERLKNGLATRPELLQAQQQSAQYEFETEEAMALESDAMIALVNSIGTLPTRSLKVADVLDGPLSEHLDDSVDHLIDRALSQRPDLVGKLANLRAKQAEVRAARAEFFPKVAVDAHVARTDLDVSVNSSDYFGATKNTYGAAVVVELPIFDGFARNEKLRVAESEARAAESELENARDDVVRDVWKAYTDFKTALRKQESAAKLLTAAQNANDAVLEAYQHGLGTYVEVVTTQRNLIFAQSTNYETRAAIYANAAALAFSLGDLARPTPPPARISGASTTVSSTPRAASKRR